MFRALLLTTLFIPLALLSGEPPIDVEVYFSKDDKHWPEAEKKLAEVNKKFPRLNLKKVSIDDDAGYKQLAQREKEFNIKQRGDLVILFGPYPLISKGEDRLAENSLEVVVTRALNPQSGKGRLHSDPAAFVKETFGEGAQPEALGDMHDKNILFFKALKDGKLAGYIVDAYLPNRCPMCNDTQFFLALSPELKITTLKTVHDIEHYGTPLPADCVAKFLDQFKGRGPTQAPQEVDGITGATKTVSAYENAIFEIVNELQERAKK